MLSGVLIYRKKKSVYHNTVYTVSRNLISKKFPTVYFIHNIPNVFKLYRLIYNTFIAFFLRTFSSFYWRKIVFSYLQKNTHTPRTHINHTYI